MTGATVMSESEKNESPATPADASQAASSQAPPGAAASSGSGSEPPAPPSGEAEGPEVELARLRERLLRTAADFDNYRKRSRRDIADAERRVQENLLQVLVPPFDNLERAAQHAESAQDVKSLAEGLKMVLRQFEDALGTVGIVRISSLGKPFDPSEHEAVQHIQTNDVPPGVVAQELRAGYRWQDRLIRPALVVVAKAPAESATAQGQA
ncbi:MAG TPA: nucleotide exchange factor GrpE [Polyangiaceae bacterium]|nr:nucleotide exchange factor GrpE [Polyangiaceae bacterium]